ncbi:Ribulose bisphosphate carboxylase-like protein [bacterium HR40]|nr:Ribulose bisphosphate carboxylase-like protein [bacterium HR40]
MNLRVSTRYLLESGIDPPRVAELVDQLCPAGIDFTGDGELLADGPHRPFEARARPVSPVLREHAERLGGLPMSAPNLTGEIDDMRRRHDLVPALGGSCAMVSLDSVGLVGFPEVGRRSRLPLDARRNGSGYLSRRPRLGWDCRAWSKIGRLGDARGARGCLGRRAGATDDRLRARPGSARALCPMRGDRAHPLSTGKPDPAHDPRAGAVRERGCRLRDGAARSDRGSDPPRRTRAALVDGTLGHRSIELGIPFGAFPGRFSGGAFLAVESTKTPILRPDWRERLFAARPVRQSAIEICDPGGQA